MIRASRYFLPSCSLLFTSFLLSCGGGGGSGGNTKDVTPPTVVSTSPANHATNVPVTATINATFSESMSLNSVVEGAAQVTPTVTGVVTYNGTTVTLTPASVLSYATTYTVTITTAAKDVAGNAMSANYAWSFTTVEAPPVVIATDPASDATGVPVEAVVKATFSKPMEAGSITATTFTLTPSVLGTISYGGTTASFTPTAPLAFATKYTATLTTAVKDVGGNALAAIYTWSFTTVPVPSAPVASAGPDQDVNRSSTVTLDGSASYAPSGRPLTYTWTQVLGSDVTGGAGTLPGVRPTFAAPSEVGTVQFNLVVNDTLANSVADRVQINVMKDANKGVFVSKTGVDTAAGTRAAPLLTIQTAINKAATPRADVYVGAGQFNEAVTLANGVSIFGGFDAANGWVRGPTNVTTIAAPTSIAVSGDSLGTPIEIQQVTIRAAAATATGASSIGVRISGSTALVSLRGCLIQAGDGAAGAAGGDAATGASGGNGGNGGAGTAGGAAGGAGSSACGVGGGAGGAGVTGSFDGNFGGSGHAAGGGAPGIGGTPGRGVGQCAIAGTHGNDAPDNAGVGLPGGNGFNGGQGPPWGIFQLGAYLPPLAGNGLPGTPGGGGGGGGSGSGDSSYICNPFPSCGCVDRTSGGGGGGGAGGCAGGVGTGGRGGGGSFAVVSLSSTVTVDSCQLKVGRGGAGGRGGGGGVGGPAGGGGFAGAHGDATAGAGAPGKVGGNGGASGNGTGGPGGPSVCVAYVGQLPTRPSTTCERLGGGAGGAGGQNPLGPAPKGQDGPSADTFAF